MATPNAMPSKRVLTVTPVRESRIDRVFERRFAETERNDGVANSRAYLQARARAGLGKVKSRDTAIYNDVCEQWRALPIWDDCNE